MIQKTTVTDWTLASRQCCEWISGDDEAGCEETVTKQRVVLENLGAVGSGAQCHVFEVSWCPHLCLTQGTRQRIPAHKCIRMRILRFRSFAGV